MAIAGLIVVGLVVIAIAAILIYLDYHGDFGSEGQMEIDLGKLKGPVWFLLLVLGSVFIAWGLIAS